jgi:hypothetical protein
MKFLEKTILASGYENTQHFLSSTFHPDSLINTTITTGIATGIAVLIETFLGIHLVVILVILGLFSLELFTGIKASYKDGYGWCTKKFGKGFLKLTIYTLMVGFTNLLAIYGPVETYWSYEFNHYKWLHYLFSNFVIINYILSNLENFIRLGWKDQFGLVEKIAKYFNLHVLTIKKEKDEGKISK